VADHPFIRASARTHKESAISIVTILIVVILVLLAIYLAKRVL